MLRRQRRNYKVEDAKRLKLSNVSKCRLEAWRSADRADSWYSDFTEKSLL